MNAEDFPGRFLGSLQNSVVTPGSTISALPTTPSNPVTLYQPVQRVFHVALLQLNCNAPGSPRLDPTRVQSAGIVIRRVVQFQGTNSFDAPPSAWVTYTDGRCQWAALNQSDECLDPDPTKRPLPYSGQPALDALLAAQALSGSATETTSPAFVAAPAVCDGAGITFVYAVIPTASSEITTAAPAVPQYTSDTLSTLAAGLPTLLKEGSHPAALPGQAIDYHYMSDDYAAAHNATGTFTTFTLTLRMLYSVFGAFDNTPQAQAILNTLNTYNVWFQDGSSQGMGDFYQSAKTKLIDYDTPGGQTGPQLVMPTSWDAFNSSDESAVLSALTNQLQVRSPQVAAPLGRYHDSSRYYRCRIFLRIKGHTPDCPTKLVWSEPSDPFRIAAWHEGSGRTQAPVPLPDPTDRNFLKNAKPNCSFSVPAGLMNAMQGSTLSGLSSGAAPAGGGLQLSWICGFSIPLITICAFFVLNIFLTLLNIVFFWLPFIKICIPFPLPTPANSGDANGT
jgi:hypothetical protein